MVPVTKVPKLLGEIELILKHLFSLVFLLYFRDSTFLSKDHRERLVVPFPKSPSPFPFVGANARVQILIRMDSDSPLWPSYIPELLWKPECF